MNLFAAASLSTILTTMIEDVRAWTAAALTLEAKEVRARTPFDSIRAKEAVASARVPTIRRLALFFSLRRWAATSLDALKLTQGPAQEPASA